jgi:hypothetical protein
VETLLRLPNQGKKEPMILLGIYPTEWDLPRQDREKLTMLVGLSAVEWEKRAHEERERGGANQAVAVYCLRYCNCPWPPALLVPAGHRVASPAVRARRSWRDWRARWLGCRVAIKVGGSCVCRESWWAWQPYARVVGGPRGILHRKPYNRLGIGHRTGQRMGAGTTQADLMALTRLQLAQ